MNHSKIMALRLGLVVVICMTFAQTAFSQAYCALRDPIATIEQFAPASSGHRSITEMVGAAARKNVTEKLPFTLHFNELGKHTLYIVLKDGKPDGIVHARSEKGKWGMVEIVWYLDLDLKVRDFRFQRCRDRNKSEFETIAKQLRGKGFDEILAMLDKNGESAVAGKFLVPDDAKPLGLTCLRCALKTIAVTESAWKEYLPKLRKESRAKNAQKSARVNPIESPYNTEVMAILRSLHQEEEWIVDRERTSGISTSDEDGNVTSLTIITFCTSEEPLVSISWSISAAGKISMVEILSDRPSEDIVEAFAGLEGLDLNQIGDCCTAAQLAAAEVLAISKVHL